MVYDTQERRLLKIDIGKNPHIADVAFNFNFNFNFNFYFYFYFYF